MVRSRGWVRQLIRTPSISEPYSSNAKAIRVDHAQPFEEERLPWYHANQFYPVHIGETFASKYKVVGKLGYGAYSTVWLCRGIKSMTLSRIIPTQTLTDEAEILAL